MLVRKSCCLLVLAMAIAGCSEDVEARGSSDWMLGIFSSTSAGHDTSSWPASLRHYEFREDGTLTEVALTHCEENREELLQEYNWSRAGDSSVIVHVPAPESEVYQKWVVTLGVTCNDLQVNKIQDGEAKEKRTFWRGAVCLKLPPPCKEVECASCQTIWCDEPPPPCE